MVVIIQVIEISTEIDLQADFKSSSAEKEMRQKKEKNHDGLMIMNQQ